MADLIYNQSNFNDQIRRTDQTIKKLENEKEEFQRNYDIVKRNWSGDEFNKADAKLMEIDKTLDKVIEDQKQQRNYLQEKNDNFASQVTGL